MADAHFPPACLRMQNRCGKFAIPSLRSLRLPPGTPDHGGKVRASENAAGNARSRRQGPCKRERRRERQKNPLLQAGFPLRYGGTLTLWLTLFYPAKNSFGGDPDLIPHKTCVLRGPRFNTPQNIRFAGTPILIPRKTCVLRGPRFNATHNIRFAE